MLSPTQLMLAQNVWVIMQAPPEINLADGSPSGAGVGSVLVVILAVIGAIALGVMLFLGVRWLRQNVQKPAGPVGPAAQTITRETRRLINDAVNKGDHETAGDLWLRAKMYNDAAEAYVKGKAYLKAARAFQSSDNMAQAIHNYKLAGDYRQAAQLYANDKQHRAAAAEYVQAGEHELAAEQYALAGDERRAAENFERVKRYLDAGHAWERAEQPLQAAQCFAQYIDQRSKEVGQDLREHPEERKLAQRTGTLFKEAGEMERASEVFQRAGLFKEAADCLRQSGDYTRAAEMLISANQPMLAAQILEEGGEAKRAAKMRAKAAVDAQQWDVAAAELKKAGELERAAEIFERVGEHEQAAEIFEQLGQLERACTLFERAERYANAARCAELTHNFTLAAELYLKAGDVDSRLRMLELMGDFFQAGQILYELREYDRALSLLERLDSRDPLYPKSLELQGDVVRAQGRFEKAYSRYRAALGTRSADTGTLPLFYKMGRVLEEMNDANGAVQNYTLVNELDAHFEDTALRLKALRDRQRRKKTTSSGLFSSNDLNEGNQRYEIIEEIARGGMGIVYKAQDTVLGRVVAYKVLGENLRENETALKYFMREAKAAAALSHPNIVTIYDAGEQGGEVYMAMEYVEGTTLKELIRRTGSLPNEQVEYIMINCCKALEYAHSKNVIHRDIKSGNVMITRDRTLKVMDFGLAKVLNEYQNNHTQQVGTPFYMSPEQIIGRNVDFRADLYGLGCTLFECATGTVPFFKGDLSYHHLHSKPPAPRSINPALSARLELAILKLLEKNPDDRYQSASEVIRTYTTARQKA